MEPLKLNPRRCGARRWCVVRLVGLFVPVAALLAVTGRAEAPLTDETFAPRAVGYVGRIADGVTFFLPADLPPDRIPPSLCLLQPLPTGSRTTPGTALTPAFSFDATHTRATLTVAADISLYGTGEVTGPLRRNGTDVTLWNRDNYNYLDHDGHQLYQAHPWVLGVRPDGTAFGIIADSTWEMEIRLAGAIEFTSRGPSFPVIVIERDSPLAVLRELAQLTGTMPLPPKWALGYQQCRWSYHPDARVREIADGFRSRHLPCDVIWMDIHYMNAYRVFTFSPTEFPDPRALNGYLHQRGFHSVWMIDPGVKAEPGYGVFDSGTAADVWVHDAFGAPYHGSVWAGDSVFPDFTRPETRTWWSALYRDFMATGVDGVWNDMNEPSVFRVPGKTMPPHNWHRGGGGLPAGPHEEYHNVYGMLMARATREGIAAANPQRRPFVLTRANFLGGQRYAATWTGDNASTWEDLKRSVPMTLTLGLSGQPFNGPDLGGFGGNATPDLWASWVGMGVFFPFCRGHAIENSAPKEPWAFGPEVEAVARTALERRYRLLPYYYTLFRQSSLDGSPVMRPVFFADPRDPALRAEQSAFLVGSDLLVVPQWAEHPALPQGIWREISLVGEDAATDRYQAHLRLRGGAILPLGRVVQNTTEESLDPLTLLVSLDANGRASGRLYEDDGDGFGYRGGDFLDTTYEAVAHGATVEVTVGRAEGRRPRPSRRLVVQVVTDHGLAEGGGRDGTPIVVKLHP